MILQALLALWTSVARPMGDHLWQSTFFLAIAAILALALRKNQARVRYWVWLTASVKFLIPFSLLIALGSHLARPRVSTPAQVIVYSTVEDFSQPFAGQQMPVIYHPAPTAAPVSLLHLLPATLVVVWLVGIIVVLLRWAIGWVRISLMVRKAAPVSEGPEVDALRRLESTLDVRRPIRLVLSPDWMEPGIFGIFRPVLIWPEGISQHLDNRHIDAILAHEICHARRRDNLTAVLHMTVEAVFWFHPLVWWMGVRLEEERERACDEEVSLLCNQPHVYAESILKVCKFCSESPLACVSGITGADLKKRIMQIMTERVVRKLDLGRKLLLLAVGLVVVAVPIVLGQVKAAQRVMLAAVNAAPKPFRTAAHAMIALEQLPPSAEIAQTLVPAAPSSLTTGDPSAPSFDVATIKPHLASAPETMNWMGIRNNPDGIDAASATLPMLIQRAYGLVSADQVFGGPEWAKNERFDIQAKMSDADIVHMQKVSPAEAKARRELMMRALLAERFKLKFHSETKQLPVFELVVAKGGLKLTNATTDPNPSLEKGEDGKPLVMFSQATERTMVAQGLSTKALAGYLSQPTSGLERPVVDKTGLNGAYDFVLNWVPHWDRFLRGSGDSSVSPEEAGELFDALKQLGLKLQSATAPVEIVVIDHVEKPSVDGAEVQGTGGGAQGTATHSASQEHPNQSARSEFEVASVKPAAPDHAVPPMLREVMRNNGRPGQIPMASPDRVRMQNWPLLDLIAAAYSVRATQVSGPAWLSDQAFDIEAKVPEGTPTEELNAMLQSLLEERFGLKVHRGSQTGPGFALVVGKDGPKLKPATPSTAPVEGLTDEEQKAQLQQKMQADMAAQKKRRQEQLAAVGPFNNVGWSSITTEELAAQLVRFAGAPVVDETGLTGEYKVAIDTWSNPDVPGGTIFDAVEKLGLKLEPRKVTVETVVVDQVSKTPTAN